MGVPPCRAEIGFVVHGSGRAFRDARHGNPPRLATDTGAIMEGRCGGAQAWKNSKIRPGATTCEVGQWPGTDGSNSAGGGRPRVAAQPLGPRERSSKTAFL